MRMSLIHLSQIRGGIQLQKDLEDLKKSYDASKVLTDLVKPERATKELLTVDGEGNLVIANTPAVVDIHNDVVLYADGVEVESNKYEFDPISGVFTILDENLDATDYEADYSYYLENEEDESHYNVNELIKALNFIVNEQLGGGAGSVDERIQAAVDEINNKPIKDRVKVLGSIKDGVVTIVKPEDVDIDESQDYVLYFENNKPVQGPNGNVITYNFATGNISDTPSMLDPEDKDPDDGLSYIDLTGEHNIKVFPVATYTFGTLPEEYLLDNNDYNAIAYSQAIDKIIVDLAQDQELIEQIKALVGEKSVKDQIEAITNELDNRIKVVEDAIAILNGDKTVIGSVEEKIQAAIEALEAAVEFNIQSKYVELYNTNLNLQEQINKLKAIKEVLDEVETVDDNQTSFTLSKKPTLEDKVRLIINSAIYKEEKHFTVDRENQSVEWIFTEDSGGFNILNDFDLEFVYKTEEEVEDLTDQYKDLPVENKVPVLAVAIGPQTVEVGSFIEIDLSSVFNDEDDDMLVLSQTAYGNEYADIELNGNVLKITGVAEGEFEVATSAKDEKGGTVYDKFKVTVVPADSTEPSPGDGTGEDEGGEDEVTESTEP